MASSVTTANNKLPGPAAMLYSDWETPQQYTSQELDYGKQSYASLGYGGGGTAINGGSDPNSNSSSYYMQENMYYHQQQSVAAAAMCLRRVR